MSDVLTPAALSVYLLEILKGFWRTYVANDPLFEFPPRVLGALLVALNFLSGLVLAGLAVPGNSFPTDWVAWTQSLLVAVLASLVSSALYVVGFKPFVQFKRLYEAGYFLPNKKEPKVK